MRNGGNKIPSQKESEEGMKKCPKTITGIHKIEKRLFIPQGMTSTDQLIRTVIALSDTMRVKMCIYCGLIDDRPTKGGKKV